MIYSEEIISCILVTFHVYTAVLKFVSGMTVGQSSMMDVMTMNSQLVKKIRIVPIFMTQMFVSSVHLSHALFSLARL